MFERQKYARLTPAGFLERAFHWLNEGSDIGIFYAALELRFAFDNTCASYAALSGASGG